MTSANAFERHLLPRRGLLAVAAMVDVAHHGGRPPVAARDLALRHGLPPRHLETLLQALVRAGLLKGMRGPGGGYALSREGQRITAGDVMRAVAVEPVVDPAPSRLLADVVEPAASAAAAALVQALDTLSIETLRREALKKGVFAEGAEREGFAP